MRFAKLSPVSYIKIPLAFEKPGVASRAVVFAAAWNPPNSICLAIYLQTKMSHITLASLNHFHNLSSEYLTACKCNLLRNTFGRWHILFKVQRRDTVNSIKLCGDNWVGWNACFHMCARTVLHIYTVAQPIETLLVHCKQSPLSGSPS